MESPTPGQLIDQLRSLPAAQPLLARLGDATGVHLVGGAVRDLLLGGSPSDLDLVVEGDAAQLAEKLGGEVRVHDRFGTSTVSLDGYVYDLARARRESYARPGALPDVEPASLTEDLLRRDFTVNALALAIGGPRAGELSSAPRALEDLSAERLRVLHERSFVDDPTRLLRLARYAGRLGFGVEPATAALAAEAIADGALSTVSGSRIGAELRMLARERDPVGALGAANQLGIDGAIAPGFGFEEPDLARRALKLLPADGRPDLLVLAVAARRMQASELERVLDALAFERSDRETIAAAATRADALAAALADAEADSELVELLAGSRPESAALAGALGEAAKAARWLEQLRHVRLEIDGADLLAAGVPEGPAIGRGLRAALAAKLDGLAPDREAQLAEALRAAR